MATLIVAQPRVMITAAKPTVDPIVAARVVLRSAAHRRVVRHRSSVVVLPPIVARNLAVAPRRNSVGRAALVDSLAAPPKAIALARKVSVPRPAVKTIVVPKVTAAPKAAVTIADPKLVALVVRRRAAKMTVALKVALQKLVVRKDVPQLARRRVAPKAAVKIVGLKVVVRKPVALKDALKLVRRVDRKVVAQKHVDLKAAVVIADQKVGPRVAVQKQAEAPKVVALAPVARRRVVKVPAAKVAVVLRHPAMKT
ncbi:hypothetical protein [Anatilimnocola floriformis]|uniref:hypothetical protein n=1 Tax=Anatilimnocola floriformis TaxID=2948575 RepID=UPI0020C2BB74|nr:hypothetical protein [Anatilimnocola floriformis]